VKERCFKLLNLEKDKVKRFYKEKAWKRKIDKVTFVGDNFTRKPPKYERFIRPTGLRFKKANITHPELKTTF
jgi:ribosome biogenesis protein NSA2